MGVGFWTWRDGLLCQEKSFQCSYCCSKDTPNRRLLVMRPVKIAFLGQQQAAAAACSSLQAERENDRNLMRDARESVEAIFHSWTKHAAFRVWSDRQGLDCFTLVQPQSGCPMVAGMILLQNIGFCFFFSRGGGGTSCAGLRWVLLSVKRLRSPLLAAALMPLPSAPSFKGMNCVVIFVSAMTRCGLMHSLLLRRGLQPLSATTAEYEKHVADPAAPQRSDFGICLSP